MKRKKLTKGVTNPKPRKTVTGQLRADKARAEKAVKQVREIHETAREENRISLLFGLIKI